MNQPIRGNGWNQRLFLLQVLWLYGAVLLHEEWLVNVLPLQTHRSATPQALPQPKPAGPRIDRNNQQLLSLPEI